jgi:hypothetical protein
MSYDVYLEAATGGEPATIWERNHTSNTSGMWSEAGCDIAAFDGCSGAALGQAAHEAIMAISSNVPKYRTMEPGNGWGTVETTLAFLHDIHNACTRYPATTVRISR